MNCWADMGVPSGCQKVVHIMCWMVRLAVGKPDLDLVRFSGSGSRAGVIFHFLVVAAGRFRLCGSGSTARRPFFFGSLSVWLHEVVDGSILAAYSACRGRMICLNSIHRV